MLLEVLWPNKNQGELSHLKHNHYFIAQKYITSVDDPTPLPSCHPLPPVLNTPTPPPTYPTQPYKIQLNPAQIDPTLPNPIQIDPI